jgi:heme-degrading monooxygenase HmoA
MVVFVNRLTLRGSHEDLMKIYEQVAEFFSRQPGLVRYQLIRAVDDPRVYFNIAEWTDAESFRRATRQEAFQTAVRVSEVSTGEPHLCEPVLSGRPVESPAP